MHVIVMGCGRAGSGLANRLNAESHSVSVIDANEAARKLLSKGFRGNFLVGSGFNRSLLEQANIREADAFVALSSNDAANIVAARTARDEFHVPTVIARIYDPARADLYRELGISTVAHVQWILNQAYEMLFFRDLVPERTFGNGETVLLRSAIPDYLDGHPVQEFEVDGSIRVVEITRGGHSLVPTVATAVEHGDRLSFVVAARELGRLRSFLHAAVVA